MVELTGFCRDTRHKKANFDSSTLSAISNHMDWKYTPAKGTAGGMLVGFRNLPIEVISWQ
jgi:hypothetical protein